MENSPSSTASEHKTDLPHGAVNVPVETSAPSAPTLSAVETKSPVDVTNPTPADKISSLLDKPVTWEYEFSFRAHPTDVPGFVIVHDTNIMSAVERVICHEQTIDVKRNCVTGNWFFVWCGVDYCIKVGPDRPSASFHCAVDESEKLERRTRLVPTAQVDSVLDGLL